MLCKYCIFWSQTTHYDGPYNEGKCSVIHTKLSITLKTGWDGGFVGYIETEEYFGCTLFKEKKA